MSRTWVYATMTGSAPLAAKVGTRIHQSTSIDRTPDVKPFIMYRQTSDISFMRGDDGDQVASNGYFIFVHDEPGDYLDIDATIAILRALFSDVVDQANDIVRCQWIETSEDFRDDDMGTICKFIRIQVLARL